MTIYSQVINKLPANDRLGLTVSSLRKRLQLLSTFLDVVASSGVQEKVKHLTFINYY